MARLHDDGPEPAGATGAWQCPFFSAASAICQAALPPRTPPRQVRDAACGSGDYEDCTTFLARLLNRRPARVL